MNKVVASSMKLKLDMEPRTYIWSGVSLNKSEVAVYWVGLAGHNRLRVPEECLKVAEALGIPVNRDEDWPLPYCEFDYKDPDHPIDPRVIAFFSEDNEGAITLLRPLSELERIL